MALYIQNLVFFFAKMLAEILKWMVYLYNFKNGTRGSGVKQEYNKSIVNVGSQNLTIQKTYKTIQTSLLTQNFDYLLLEVFYTNLIFRKKQVRHWVNSKCAMICYEKIIHV